MISDDKKEEVRDAADIVEVVSDYVKLKRSGSNFVGLCPYHDEKTPSFNVTPRLGIFKCFGCGESGDVFKFVMDQEGVGFTEAVRQLAERYGIFIPEEDREEDSESAQLREGILHALRFAGLYYYRNLMENEDAKKALKYLDQRGYPGNIIKQFGLGYAPGNGDALLQAALKAGISEEYLSEAGLIKPSNRGEGFYDTFRDRLMFPIFNPTGKVIAFAGRVLGDSKTAKYINSPQTKVYNKSEVVYGVNFSKNSIRKEEEVILVEGYTDVITLHQHGIENVVASSGTALTSGQLRILHRYGERIIMIYDSDSAGQAAMKRGIRVALEEGLEVRLLELPENQDPDSFVKQFGKESFEQLKREESLDFVDFLMLKAEEEGDLEAPVQQKKVITDILEAIAHIPDTIQRQVYVQHLHQKTQRYRKGTDRELFEELERLLADLKEEKKRSRRREANARNRNQASEQPPHPGQLSEISGKESAPPQGNRREASIAKKKPHYEKELIRLMITYGRPMVEYICSLTNNKLFEDDELRNFYNDVVDRYKNEEEISIQAYRDAKDPFPHLVGDVLLEQYTASDRHEEKVGKRIEKDENPYLSAKSTIKTLELSFYRRKRAELAELSKTSDAKEKRKIIQKQAEIQSKLTRREMTHSDDLYPDPEGQNPKKSGNKIFTYTMKGDKK